MIKNQLDLWAQNDWVPDVIVVDYKSLCGEVQTGSYTGPLEILYKAP